MTTDRSGKAALVEKPRTERVAAALEAEGVYDPSRRIDAYDADRIALPITDPPTETDVEAVVDLDLPLRRRGLEDVLEARGVPDHIVEAAPASWAVIGDVLLVDFGDVSAVAALDRAARETVGEALLEVHGEAETDRGCAGTFLAVDPTLVGDRGTVEDRVLALREYIAETEFSGAVPTGPTAYGDRALLPGEPEHLRESTCREHGVPLAEADVTMLCDLAVEYGIEDAIPSAFEGTATSED